LGQLNAAGEVGQPMVVQEMKAWKVVACARVAGQPFDIR